MVVLRFCIRMVLAHMTSSFLAIPARVLAVHADSRPPAIDSRRSGEKCGWRRLGTAAAPSTPLLRSHPAQQNRNPGITSGSLAGRTNLTVACEGGARFTGASDSL